MKSRASKQMTNPKRRTVPAWCVLLTCLTATAALAVAPIERVEADDLYRAHSFGTFEVTKDLAETRGIEPWKLDAQEHSNFIHFSPEVRGLEFGGEGMRFETSGEQVTLGWGNYDGRQAIAERMLMFAGWNEIEMTVQQTAGRSQWDLALWSNGESEIGRYSPDSLVFWARPTDSVTVEGTEPQTIRLRAFRSGPDGFGLTIKGPPGNRIRIESLRITQTLSQGYFRKEFQLPGGEIWRAVGEIAQGRTLYVNGAEVAAPRINSTTAPVDLAPYLAPGRRNVICIRAEQSSKARGAPFVYFHGKVIMADGETIPLDTGMDWCAAAEPAAGWTDAEFDSEGWEAAPIVPLSATYLTRRWPAYDGRLLIENPGDDPLLYFDSGQPLQFRVRGPAGLAKEDATLEWTLRRVKRDHSRPESANGSVGRFTESADNRSIVYAVDAGRHEPGVYTVELRLTSDDRLIERRFEEPLIVLGRLPMKEVAGNAYEEGMEIELEQIIDFTEPDGPHRWVESKSPRARFAEPTEGVSEPRIVRKGDLLYREVTDAGRQAMFSYEFEFQRPHSWYLMVLEYPNDAHRWIGVSVSSAVHSDRGGAPVPWRTTATHNYESQDGPSLVTGDKYPLDHRMHEMRWLHWADPEMQTLDIVNLHDGLRAAAARVRIYRVNQLPAVAIKTSGERFFGIHTERARSLGRTFADSGGMNPYQHRYNALGLDMVGRFTARLRWQFDACRNYTEYLRFTGQNLHVMGAFQYSEANTSYDPPERVPGDGRLLQDIRETALRFFHHNDISMVSMVEYIGHNWLKMRYAASDAAVAQGADTIHCVSRDGNQGGWHGNPNHPAVEEAYLLVIDDLAEKFAWCPAWKGIYYLIYVDQGGGFTPGPYAPHADPFEFDYSDATIRAFERDTGIAVPGEDDNPDRFRLRYLFLTSEAMLETWIDWRCFINSVYIEKTLDTLHRHRDDLNVMYGFHVGGGAIRYWLVESGETYRRVFRKMAMDPSVVKDNPHAWFGRHIYPTGPSSAGEPYHWAQIVGEEAIAYYDQGPNRLVTLSTCWHELPTSAPGYFSGNGGVENVQPPDWPIPYNVSRFISQAHDDNVMEPFTQAMIGADPDVLLFGFTDVNIINSREQHVREVAQVVTSLPGEKFEPVGGSADFRHNLAVRALQKGDDYWFYVANPGCWNVRGRVVLSDVVRVVRPHDEAVVDTVEERGRTIVPVELHPYGMLAFRAESPAVAVEGWRIEPLPESEVTHMKGIIAEVRSLVTDPDTVLAITGEDVNFIRALLREAEARLADGEYAAAWSELTTPRFWKLWTEHLAPARDATVEGDQ